MFPVPKKITLICAILFPLFVRAEPVASEPKTHTWFITPELQGMTIENKDTWVDYSREGKVVYRTVERVGTVKMKSGESSTVPKKHSIEFVADGKVFASVEIDKADTPIWEITCQYPLLFECLPTGNVIPNGRAFRVCVPKLDYFEYFEIIDNKITFNPSWRGFDDADKKRCIINVERGYIDREQEGR